MSRIHALWAVLVLGMWVACSTEARADQPAVVVTFDNGGFNLPMYTRRWNGRFSQPSVAQQLASDLARMEGQAPRVFTYLPPGRVAGRSSDPFEVVPRLASCAPTDTPPAEGEDCWCPPGDRCWESLDVNRDPAASTSLFQVATAIRARVEGPRLEVHFTDLFEEDPASAENPADADQCVTEAGTRKALEALFRPVSGSLDHVAVGVLTARIDPPQSPEGGAIRFVSEGDGCWSAERARTFGGGGAPLEFAMGVVLIGVDTAASDDVVRRFAKDLERQVSGDLSLELVMVREPPTSGVLAGGAVPASDVRIGLGEAPERSTPCATVTADLTLESGPESVPGAVDATCSSLGVLEVSEVAIERAFYQRAGLNPFVGTLGLRGTVHVYGDQAPIRNAVLEVGQKAAVIDRPLPFWNAIVAALRFDANDGVWRPPEHFVQIEDISVTGADHRPWAVATMCGLVLMLAFTVFGTLLLNRFAANRAFRRHLSAASASGRPVAAVLAEAGEEARSGWVLRLLASATLGFAIGAVAALVLLLVYGATLG
jgi:hypothetical protein